MRTIEEMLDSHAMRPVSVTGPEIYDLLAELRTKGWKITATKANTIYGIAARRGCATEREQTDFAAIQSTIDDSNETE